MSDSARSRRQLDAAARLAAQTVFDRPIALEAGAGTGKTATLVARIAAWCLGPGWDLEEADSTKGSHSGTSEIAGRVLDGVVAITFTEDAAAEMAERVSRAFFVLEQWQGETETSADFPDLAEIRTSDDTILHGLFRQALPADPETVRTRARALLIQIEHLRTSTIHAFAASILRRFPLEAGIHPTYTVDAENSRTRDLVERATEEILARAYGGDDPKALGLAEIQIGPAEIGEAAINLMALGLTSEDLERDPFDQLSAENILKELGSLLEKLRPSLQLLAGASKRAPSRLATAEKLLNLDEMLAQFHEASMEPLECLAGLRARVNDHFSDSEDRILGAWVSGRLGKTYPEAFDFDELPEIATNLRQVLNHIQNLDPVHFNHLRQLLLRIFRQVEEEKTRLGVITFSDLLRETKTLLKREQAVRRRIQSEIRQLLVDEMQDTDPEQAEIVSLLALETTTPHEARPCLFLVGDPKQSIYGWRNADLAVYESLVHSILKVQGQRHELTINFRSAPVILDEVRRLVEPNMHPEAGFQPQFVKLEACARLLDDPGFHSDSPRRRPVEYWAIAGPQEGNPSKLKANTKADEGAGIEAEAVASDIASLHAQGAALSGMCILMRSRSKLQGLLEALKRSNIPYVVGKDSSYFKSREVVEAIALMRLILDPHDPLALVTVMRSPLVGIPDAALLPLWKHGLPSLVAEISGGLPLPESARPLVNAAAADIKQLKLGKIRGFRELSGWPEALLNFLESLSRLRESWREDPPDSFLEKLRTETLIEALATARFPGAYRLANIERFLGQMEDLLLEGASARELLRRLRQWVREQPEDPSGQPREDAGEAVRVLTIHGAKGLEFEHVWLIQTHSSRGGGQTAPHDAGFIDERPEMLMAGLRSPGYFRLQQRKKGVEKAELVRLIYVATTRAKRRLVISGICPEKKAKSGSILELLQRRQLEESSADWAWPTPSQLNEALGDDARLEKADALWACPGLGDFSGAREPSILQVGDPEKAQHPEIAADEARLRKLREAACVRMQRPWLEPISREAHRRFSQLIAEEIEGGTTPEEETPRRRDTIGRDIATATGSAVHRLLEHFEFDAEDPERELQLRQDRARDWLKKSLEPEKHAGAFQHFDQLIQSFRGGKLWDRWLEVGPHALARELPVILSPRTQTEGPVGAFTGNIDFLYADPDSGDPVVVDFKTDRPTDLERLSSAYSAQLRPYAEAIRETLKLKKRPRMELWFLAVGKIVRWEAGQGDGTQ